MIEYSYTRYKVMKDGTEWANTADAEQAKNIALAYNGTIEEYIATVFLTKKEYSKIKGE